MKIFINVTLVVLVLLATSSGITKIMLMQQEVQFFSEYGFTNPILIFFGVVQLGGGVLLIFPKSRIVGALIVLATFLISAVLLLLSGKTPVALITLAFAALIVLVIKLSLNAKST